MIFSNTKTKLAIGLLINAMFATHAYAVLPTPAQSPQFKTFNPADFPGNAGTATNSYPSNQYQTYQPARQVAQQNNYPTNTYSVPTSATYTSSTQKTNNIGNRVTASVLRNGQLIPVNSSSQLNSGDILEYTALVSNTSSKRVRSMLVTLSIPNEVELLNTQTLSPQFAMGSADGRNFYSMPIKVRANGVLQSMKPSSYKALRWQVEDLGLNETTSIKYRAKVK